VLKPPGLKDFVAKKFLSRWRSVLWLL